MRIKYDNIEYKHIEGNETLTFPARTFISWNVEILSLVYQNVQNLNKVIDHQFMFI